LDKAPVVPKAGRASPRRVDRGRRRAPPPVRAGLALSQRKRCAVRHRSPPLEAPPAHPLRVCSEMHTRAAGRTVRVQDTARCTRRCSSAAARPSPPRMHGACFRRWRWARLRSLAFGPELRLDVELVTNELITVATVALPLLVVAVDAFGKDIEVAGQVRTDAPAYPFANSLVIPAANAERHGHRQKQRNQASHPTIDLRRAGDRRQRQRSRKVIAFQPWRMLDDRRLARSCALSSSSRPWLLGPSWTCPAWPWLLGPS